MSSSVSILNPTELYTLKGCCVVGKWGVGVAKPLPCRLHWTVMVPTTACTSASAPKSCFFKDQTSSLAPGLASYSLRIPCSCSCGAQ